MVHTYSQKHVPSIQSKMVSKLKTDPIIAVRDVPASSKWYQSVLSLKSKHDGTEFDILTTLEGEVALCLHRWQADHHPTMTDASIPVGHGLILYFRTDEMEHIRRQAKELNVEIDQEIHLNTNTNRREFALRDPDGYYLIVSEFHEYEG